jgi:hypothetical protein
MLLQVAHKRALSQALLSGASTFHRPQNAKVIDRSGLDLCQRFRCQSHSLQPPNSRRNELVNRVMLRAAGVIQEARMTTTDLFQQRVKECRPLAAAAGNASDKVFWLGLVERWQAVESRSARGRCPAPGRSESTASLASNSSPQKTRRRPPFPGWQGRAGVPR